MEETRSDADLIGVYAQALHQFAEGLSHLHIECGAPTLAELSQRARIADRRYMSPASLSEVFRGKRLPSREFLDELITQLSPGDTRLLDEWRKRWSAAKRAERGAADARRRLKKGPGPDSHDMDEPETATLPAQQVADPFPRSTSTVDDRPPRPPRSTAAQDQTPSILLSRENDLGSLARQMQVLNREIAEYRLGHPEWLINLTTYTASSIYATSTAADRYFWNSELATRYLAAQAEAIRERAVAIRRLFLVVKPDHVSESLWELYDAQRKIGIEVRIAELKSSAHLNRLVIFDSTVCYETAPEMWSEPARTTLKMTPRHVRESINNFNTLWQASQQET